MKFPARWPALLLGCLLVPTLSGESLAQYPVPAPAPAPVPTYPSLGILGQTYVSPRTGQAYVYVTTVYQGSPATRLWQKNSPTTFTLVAGRDYIARVNGRLVGTPQELREALARSPQECRLEIYDASTQVTATFYTYLW